VSERALPERAEWAKGSPARQFRLLMEPMARALLAERERDEAEADLAAERARAAAAEVENAAMRQLLADVEWEGVSYQHETCSPACVVCLAPTADGHREGCRLAAMASRDPGTHGSEILAAGNALAVELQDAAFGWEMVPRRVQEDARVALDRWRALVPRAAGDGEVTE
jgi:hypothetical protein